MIEYDQWKCGNFNKATSWGWIIPSIYGCDLGTARWHRVNTTSGTVRLLTEAMWVYVGIIVYQYLG